MFDGHYPVLIVSRHIGMDSIKKKLRRSLPGYMTVYEKYRKSPWNAFAASLYNHMMAAWWLFVNQQCLNPAAVPHSILTTGKVNPYPANVENRTGS
jgi:hypothetical protein